jgi:hypothetical protein
VVTLGVEGRRKGMTRALLLLLLLRLLLLLLGLLLLLLLLELILKGGNKEGLIRAIVREKARTNEMKLSLVVIMRKGGRLRIGNEGAEEDLEDCTRR